MGDVSHLVGHEQGKGGKMTEQDKCAACDKSAKGPLVVTQDDFYCVSCAKAASPASIDAIKWTVRMLAEGKAEVVEAAKRRYTSSQIHGLPHKCMSCGERPWHLIRHEGRTECIPCALTRWPQEMEKLIDDLH